MAKLTKAQRSAIAKKAARTRKRNAPVRRKYSVQTKSTTRRPRRRRALKQRNVMMARIMTIGAGMMGGGAYLASNFVWKPDTMTMKLVKTAVGTVVLSMVSGPAAAGFAGAGMADLATSIPGLGAGHKPKLRACGQDNTGRMVLSDNRGNKYYHNPSTGKYQMASQYSRQMGY
jgi:hypothetical protein